MKKIYVANLPPSATEAGVNELFSQHGIVHSIVLIVDPDSGRLRGFGFVKMDNDAAIAAIADLDGHLLEGRKLKVRESQENPRLVDDSV